MDCHKYHTIFVKGYIQNRKVFIQAGLHIVFWSNLQQGRNPRISPGTSSTRMIPVTHTGLLYLDRFLCLSVMNILTCLTCPVCSVSSLLIKYIRKNLVKRETLFLFVWRWRDCLTSERRHKTESLTCNWPGCVLQAYASQSHVASYRSNHSQYHI